MPERPGRPATLREAIALAAKTAPDPALREWFRRLAGGPGKKRNRVGTVKRQQ
jgi:hypothetical protein